MKLVALARAPAIPENAAGALAQATGMALAEARMRIAPEPPALLARLGPDQATALVVALRAAGIAALALELRVPTDGDRHRARRLSLDQAGATFVAGSGAELRFAWPEVLAVLRGARTNRTDVERTETTRRLSLGRAMMSGGLLLSTKQRRAMHSSSEAVEQVILLYLRDGRVAQIAEQELQFACLGPAMQPSRVANMVRIAAMLREHTPSAFHDERLVRLGCRPLPFLMDHGSRSDVSGTVTTRSDTIASLDVLAEVMRSALAEGLLP